MGRTKDEISQFIDDDLPNRTALAGMASDSATAVYKDWKGLTVEAEFLHEQLWDKAKAELQELATRAVAGNDEWYLMKVREFQYGDPLIVTKNSDGISVPGYATIDETKRIVARAAMRLTPDRILQFKVAKIEGGSLAPFSADQLTAINAYINRFKFAGTGTGVVSLNADLLRLAGTYYYDPLLIVDDIKADLDAKVGLYLADIDFREGKVHLQQVVDAIQSGMGYKDFDLDTIEAKASGAGAWTPFDLVYTTLAGYILPDSPISEMLTFTPYV
jgi:hypothetical protein